MRREGKELYIVAGGEGAQGTIANGNVTVPTYTWKVALVLDRPGAAVTQNTQTIAIRMPNNNSVRGRDWTDYLVTVDRIESSTGFDFFSAVSNSIESTIESRVYNPNSNGGFTPTPTPTPTPPNPGFQPRLSIRSLLPNPSGNESINEAAEIVNEGNTSVNLTGWKLKDNANTTWSLDEIGTLGNNQSGTIRRNNQRMALNNSGDTIQLIDPFGNVVDTVTYRNALTDRAIFFA